ncbi:hypothetical protein ACOXXX_08265 [Thalassococcus sp. BH17M4-6]|uniref:hypothetical protein n=1 Tax=Thalassococcus sp. BH17M4-6 TaxID=3413148 RepID=UPI003BE84A3B
MTLDIPHMIASLIIIGAVIYGTNHLSQFDGISKGKRSLVQFVTLFVLLFILNLAWPYGG